MLTDTIRNVFIDLVRVTHRRSPVKSLTYQPLRLEMLTNLHGSYSYHDTLKGIYYGQGCTSSGLPQLLRKLGGTRALIVTGKSLREKTSVISTVERVLTDNDAYGGTFSQIREHSPVQGIIDGVKAFNDTQSDIFVSVGGGSPIDATKVMIHRIYEAEGRVISNIAIPTTLGAAEYTSTAGYTNEQGEKVVIANPMVAAGGIILDAKLTLGTPEKLWLSTGLRALDHAVETLYSSGALLPVTVLCYAALADLFKCLPQSKTQPTDLEIRQRLMIAAWMSLWPTRVEQYRPLGLSHIMGHRLGARYGIPHGITSCLTLAAVVSLKAETATEEDKVALAQALFYLQEPSTGTVEGDVKRLSSMIKDLVQKLGLQSNLATYNVPKEDLPKVAQSTLGGVDDPLYQRVVKVLESIY